MRRPCEICNLQQTMHMDMHVLKINKQLFCILQTLSPPIHFASCKCMFSWRRLANATVVYETYFGIYEAVCVLCWR